LVRWAPGYGELLKGAKDNASAAAGWLLSSLIRSHRKDEGDTVKQTQIVLGLTILTLGFLSVAPGIRATEPPEVGANGNGAGEPFAPDAGVSLRLPLQTGDNLTLGAVAESPDEAAEADKLAKELANPIASLISVPFQANEDWGYGPTGNGYKFTLNIQPVVPLSISKDWNLIIRTILPIVSQHDLFYFANLPKDSPLQPQNRSQDGFSDTTQSFFLSPKKPGPFGLIWGLGPAFLYPTGTHPFLGTGTVSIGPTVVVLEQFGGWTVGALMNQLWSVLIEEHRSSVSQMFVQPFIAYTTKTHTTFTIDTESTANWNATSADGKWTVPVIFQISQILKIGKQPISLQIGGKYYADSPRYGPNWGVRFNFTLLYPTARPPAPVERTGLVK
jgi:hypothetical protein